MDTYHSLIIERTGKITILFLNNPQTIINYNSPLIRKTSGTNVITNKKLSLLYVWINAPQRLL